MFEFRKVCSSGSSSGSRAKYGSSDGSGRMLAWCKAEPEVDVIQWRITTMSCNTMPGTIQHIHVIARSAAIFESCPHSAYNCKKIIVLSSPTITKYHLRITVVILYKHFSILFLSIFYFNT